MIKTEQDAWTSIAQLAAEYETIAAAGQSDRWAALIRSCSLTPEEADAAIESEAFGPLTAELRRAEANGHDIERLLPAAVARYGLDDAEDVAAVLRHRLALATKPAGSGRGRRPSKLIVGLIPEALGPMAPDLRAALDERRDLIEQRARALAKEGAQDKSSWVRHLGPAPLDRRERQKWQQSVTPVAAYRDRYRITSASALGAGPVTDAQKLDRARAASAVRGLGVRDYSAPRTDRGLDLRL